MQRTRTGRVRWELVGGALLLGLACVAWAWPAPAAPSVSGATRLAPVATLTGIDSHVTDARCLRITTQDAWIALWLEHAGEPPKPKYSLIVNEAGVPVVDFDQCMVVALFGGPTVSSWGYEAVLEPAASSPPAKEPPGSGAGPGDVVLRVLEHGYQTMDNSGPVGDPANAGAFFAPGADDEADRITPFAFFVVPRSQAPLVVEDLQQGLGAPGGGRIRERARFAALPDAPPASPVAPAASVSDMTRLAPVVTLTGTDSHVTEARCLRITTPDAWIALWLEHAGEPPHPKYSLYSNKAGVPVVDFDQCMVVALFDGPTWNSWGYEAVLESDASSPPAKEPPGSRADPGDAVLRVSGLSYQTGGPDGGGVAVTTFACFVVARSQAPLVVEDFEQSMGGVGPGRIHERARFPALPDVLPASKPEPVAPR